MKTSISICVAMALGTFCVMAADKIPGMESPQCLGRTLLLSGPDAHSKFYRIPALAYTPAGGGSLVAVADRRIDNNGDLPGRIDVVARVSHDGGLSWGDTLTVARHNAGGGYGDPALGTAADGTLVCVATHGAGLWTATPDDYARIVVMRSADGGSTWTAPADITDCLYSPSAGAAPVKALTAFATSGHILTARDGNMYFVLVTRPDTDRKWGPLSIYVCCSSDGGVSWTALPACPDADADETKIAECADGRLMLSIRNRHKGWRKLAWSADGGCSWSTPIYSDTLPCPGCNGDLISLADGSLLHSIPDDPAQRRNVTLLRSTDSGASWQRIYIVCPSESAYSALAQLPDGTVAVLTEERAHSGGFRLWLSRVKVVSR